MARFFAALVLLVITALFVFQFSEGMGWTRLTTAKEWYPPLDDLHWCAFDSDEQVVESIGDPQRGAQAAVDLVD